MYIKTTVGEHFNTNPQHHCAMVFVDIPAESRLSFRSLSVSANSSRPLSDKFGNVDVFFFSKDFYLPTSFSV